MDWEFVTCHLFVKNQECNNQFLKFVKIRFYTSRVTRTLKFVKFEFSTYAGLDAAVDACDGAMRMNCGWAVTECWCLGLFNIATSMTMTRPCSWSFGTTELSVSIAFCARAPSFVYTICHSRRPRHQPNCHVRFLVVNNVWTGYYSHDFLNTFGDLLLLL